VDRFVTGLPTSNHPLNPTSKKLDYRSALGCHKASTPRRDPTTERHGDFWLLGYPPGPVRPSLADLDTPHSSRVSISMPILVWTSSQREPLCNRTPNLKPSTEPDLQEAGLQECATQKTKCELEFRRGTCTFRSKTTQELQNSRFQDANFPLNTFFRSQLCRITKN
jgi:hypothetical protein